MVTSSKDAAITKHDLKTLKTCVDNLKNKYIQYDIIDIYSTCLMMYNESQSVDKGGG